METSEDFIISRNLTSPFLRVCDDVVVWSEKNVRCSYPQIHWSLPTRSALWSAATGNTRLWPYRPYHTLRRCHGVKSFGASASRPTSSEVGVLIESRQMLIRTGSCHEQQNIRSGQTMANWSLNQLLHLQPPGLGDSSPKALPPVLEKGWTFGALKWPAVYFFFRCFPHEIVTPSPKIDCQNRLVYHIRKHCQMLYFQVSAGVIPITPKWTDKPKQWGNNR